MLPAGNSLHVVFAVSHHGLLVHVRAPIGATTTECGPDKRASLQYFLCFHCFGRPVGRLKIFWRDLHHPLSPRLSFSGPPSLGSRAVA